MKPSYSPLNRKSEPGEEPGEFQGEETACQLQIPFVQSLLRGHSAASSQERSDLALMNLILDIS